MLKVRDLMTPEVVAAHPTTPIKEVARTLVESRISGMPVVDDRDRVVGVVSEGDLIMKEHVADSIERRPLAPILDDSPAARARLAKVLALTAGDAMSRPAITIGPDANVAEAAQGMTNHHVNRLPVVEGGTLVGIVTRSDVVRAFARTDEELAEAVRRDVLNGTLWRDANSFDVSVERGRVRIKGQVERRSEAEVIERLTAMVPGVTGVDAELAWELDDRTSERMAPNLASPSPSAARIRRRTP